MPNDDDLSQEKNINSEAVEVTAESEEADTALNDSESSDVSENPDDLVQNVEFEQIEADENVTEPDSDSQEANESVTVQPVKFASFEDSEHMQGEANKNLDILMDIKLQLTVELGRTEMPIKKVLELTRGSIVELEKIAGEPVELYANGKLVAHGEVVVIEDNFGLRITNITSPENMLKGV